MGIRALFIAAVAIGVGPIAGPALAEESLSVGVAPFERVAGPGQNVPDVATRLAQRLGTQGIEKVVGPSELGADPTAAPKPEEVSAWGDAASVANIVVGRTTRLGRSLSVDARVIEELPRTVGPIANRYYIVQEPAQDVGDLLLNPRVVVDLNLPG